MGRDYNENGWKTQDKCEKNERDDWSSGVEDGGFDGDGDYRSD